MESTQADIIEGQDEALRGAAKDDMVRSSATAVVMCCPLDLRCCSLRIVLLVLVPAARAAAVWRGRGVEAAFRVVLLLCSVCCRSLFRGRAARVAATKFCRHHHTCLCSTSCLCM